MPDPTTPSDEPEEEHIPGYHIGSWVEADIAWRRLRAEVEGLEEENANLKASLHRDDGPCYYCKEMTSSVAGDPGRWPLRFCHSDELGVTKAHHVRCVSDRLNVLGAEREAALRANLEEVINKYNGEMRRSAEAEQRHAEELRKARAETWLKCADRLEQRAKDAAMESMPAVLYGELQSRAQYCRERAALESGGEV